MVKESDLLYTYTFSRHSMQSTVGSWQRHTSLVHFSLGQNQWHSYTVDHWILTSGTWPPLELWGRRKHKELLFMHMLPSHLMALCPTPLHCLHLNTDILGHIFCLIHPEDGDCNVHQNVVTASTYHVAISLKPEFKHTGVYVSSLNTVHNFLVAWFL